MLSGKDILSFFHSVREDPPLVLRYDDLVLTPRYVRSLDRASTPTQNLSEFYSNLLYQPVVILYPGLEGGELTPNVGHWTCIFCDENKAINFFDSFGQLPDTMLSDCGVPSKTLKQYKRLVKYLWMTSRRLNIPLEYNDHEFQTCKNTCGKWVCFRLYLKNLTADAFIKKVKEIFQRPQTNTITRIYSLLSGG